MQMCNTFCRLDKFGTNIQKIGLTPAEAVVLHVLHQTNAGGNVFDITKDGKPDFSDITEATVVSKPAVVKSVVVGAHTIKGKVLEAANPAQHKPEVREQDEVIPEHIEVRTVTPAVTRSRTDAEEMERLRSKYGGLVNKKGAKLLPLIFGSGLNVKLYQKFDEINFAKIQFDGIDASGIIAGGDVSKA